jgi:hypothetical protein
MDSQTQYCLMRRDLEERVWRLTNRVPELTSELIMQIGKDHQKFLHLRGEFWEINQRFTEVRRQLQDHRREHGC